MQLKKKEAMLKEKKEKVSHLCFRQTTEHLTSFKDYMDALQFFSKTNRKRRLKKKMLLRSMRLGRKRRQKASNLRPKRRKL